MERDQQMLKMKLDDEMTYQEIADHFGLSKQRVHQIIADKANKAYAEVKKIVKKRKLWR